VSQGIVRGAHRPVLVVKEAASATPEPAAER
jgi:hypothetical protein